MRLSNYFIPILKEEPREAEIVSHKYMLRAGLIRQTSAGIYAWLPIGFKVLKKVENIVRNELNRAGAIEMLMPTIQSAELWIKSGRYNNYGKEMLRIEDRQQQQMLYGPTNEEMITDIFKNAIQSYKELPRNLYHIQWKFRDEIRPRFGVMRGREFLMKDGYSFDINAAEAIKSYNRMFLAYLKTFANMGLRAIPLAADTGSIGGSMSHEFVILAKTGESNVYFHKKLLEDIEIAKNAEYSDDNNQVIEKCTGKYAASDEKHDENQFHQQVSADQRIVSRGIEVGHIFYFADLYSKPMGCAVNASDGKNVTLHSGSYGIGISRLVAAIIEACHDDAGIIWPKEMTPFDAIILNLRAADHKATQICDDIYHKLTKAGIDTLYDDSTKSAGAKFSSADLIGVPWQIIIGAKTLKTEQVEVKNRQSAVRNLLGIDELPRFIQAKMNSA